MTQAIILQFSQVLRWQPIPAQVLGQIHERFFERNGHEAAFFCLSFYRCGLWLEMHSHSANPGAVDSDHARLQQPRSFSSQRVYGTVHPLTQRMAGLSWYEAQPLKRLGRPGR